VPWVRSAFTGCLLYMARQIPNPYSLHGQQAGTVMTKSKKSQGLNRREMLAAGSAAGLVLGTSHTLAADARPIANTKYGKVRGLADGSVKIFKGVPYGASTAGANRFMPPKPPEPWSEVRDTTRFGNRAPQTDT